MLLHCVCVWARSLGIRCDETETSNGWGTCYCCIAGMDHGGQQGYRARTRDMFKKGFKQAGRTPLGTYLKTYRVGDIVDIKADPSIHAGMPHKSVRAMLCVIRKTLAVADGFAHYSCLGTTKAELYASSSAR